MSCSAIAATGLLAGGRRASMKAQRAGAVLREHTVEDECMGVQLQIEGRPEALDDHDGPSTPVRDALPLTRTTPGGIQVPHA
jgi:hypothetical protein